MNIELFVYALVATASPLGFAATLAVVASGRLKSIAFAFAFVLGQLVACALIVVVDPSFLPTGGHDHERLRSVLELVFGVALLCLAAFVRSRPNDGVPAPDSRSRNALDRLRRLSVGTALLGGLLLGIGGPKRLVLTALAGTSIEASGAQGSHAAALVVAYTAIATLLVWGPVLTYVLAGDRAVTWLRAAERSLVSHQRSLGFYSLLTVGTVAVAHSLAGLL